MVRRELPATVWRCKGVIRVPGSDTPHALQVVGRRCEIVALAPGAVAPGAGGQVVAIGRGIDPTLLDRLFAACLV
ncbi:CobW C-terminal domain-containing protein [Mycolicibacterium palauense]|uniref:GTP-binding protein n=1 Tax=Mycolicibacterium palauense TaxID=2034511 RepID=UPI000BFEC79A|nr:GTP-binding protein [Mycolicibacterium palauense]